MKLPWKRVVAGKEFHAEKSPVAISVHAPLKKYC
jgi:hypothetical protein